MTTPENGERTMEDDVKKFLGLPPYDKLHFCYLDGYFALDCKQRYGAKPWEKCVRLHGGGK